MRWSLDPQSTTLHSLFIMRLCMQEPDIFLRDNLEWLGLASNWSKFSATAGLATWGHSQGIF